MPLDRHEQEVRVLQVRQELHRVGLLVRLQHHLLGKKLVQLGVQGDLGSLRWRVQLCLETVLLHDLLQHLAAEGFKCEVCIEAELQEIRRDETAVEAAAAAAQVQNAALERVATGVEDGHGEGVEVHLLLVQEEEVEAIVRDVRLPKRQTVYVPDARHF